MSKAYARVGRDNHLNNLISRLPVLTTLYGLQCLFIYHLAGEIDIGDFALYLGLSLISFVSALFIHDKYHHVIIYKDHLKIYFEPLKIAKTVQFQDIERIIAPQEECAFASVIFKLKNKEQVAIHFVDYPVQVKKVIEELMEAQKPSDSTDQIAA